MGRKAQHSVIGAALVGREIDVKWDDNKMYRAVVVSHDKENNTYKLVYEDNAIENPAQLDEISWSLRAKKVPKKNEPVLEGSVVRFYNPRDRKWYDAMVYAHAHNGHRLKIAYMDSDETDTIKSARFQFLSTSPCVRDGYPISIDAIGAPDEHPDNLPVAAGGISKKHGKASKKLGTRGRKA